MASRNRWVNLNCYKKREDVMSNRLVRSVTKILIVVAVSIVLFIVLIPLISMVIDKGLGSLFILIMLVLFIVGVIIDRLIKSKR